MATQQSQTKSSKGKKQKKTLENAVFSRVFGGRNRTRTCDPIDVNDVLYQLSHATLSEHFWHFEE